MIVHDLATLGPDLIRNAIISAALGSFVVALLIVGLIAAITSILTGAWPDRRVSAPVEYDEAA